jgi:predicted ester cyclase
MAHDNADIARSLYEHWNAREFERNAELMLDDGEIHLVGSDLRFRGPDGVLEYSRMWADAFPDGRVTIERVIASGDHVCVEFTGRGTHTGTLRAPGGDVAPTGRSVTVHACDVYELRDGKIRSQHAYMDSASLFQQLGLLPELRVEAKA